MPSQEERDAMRYEPEEESEELKRCKEAMREKLAELEQAKKEQEEA